MDKNEDLKYQLQTLECSEFEIIEDGLLEVEYEDQNGVAGFCAVDIPELGGRALKRIVELEQRVKELETRCKDLILTYIVDDQAWDRNKEVEEIWERMEKAVQND